MEKINWGIIGCGDVTEIKSGPAFNKVNNSSLVAVMRRNAQKAKDYAHRHQVPKWYDDASSLINDPDVNAIYVATPPSTHEEFTIAALKAGKPVYVEKPMAHSYQSSVRMAVMAKKMNLKLVVAHYRREQPLFKKVKELISNKSIGDVLLAQIKLFKPSLTKDEINNPRIAWRINPSVSGGGLFHDLAPHQLDLMYYFFGPVQKVLGVSMNQQNQYKADDLVTGTILFENGTVFNGAWCFNSLIEEDHCEIIGSSGILKFNIFSGNTITLSTTEKTSILSFDLLPHVQQPMIEKTVSYFLGEGPNPCSGDEGAEVMRLIEAFTS
ncbi:MAG: Gfo/Idh/MocA family protein [Chitinophagaceae bacterium]